MRKTKKIISETRPPRKPIKPLNQGQEVLINSLRDNVITICLGPAGTGKTHISVGTAVYGLCEEQFEKIVIARPIIEAGEKLGFLPGDFEQKTAPYLMPIFDELKYYAPNGEINGWKATGELEICPLAYMRGRTLRNSFIIIDEAQNCTFQQLKMIITRIGLGSKLVMVGDETQSDLPSRFMYDFKKMAEILTGVEQVGVVKLAGCDIVRNPIIIKVLDKIEQCSAIKP